MEATFKLDAVTSLRVGNNVVPAGDIASPDANFIGMVLRNSPHEGPESEIQLAVFQPHEARALASVVLAAATTAKE